MEKGKKTWRIWRTLWKERLCVRESVRESRACERGGWSGLLENTTRYQYLVNEAISGLRLNWGVHFVTSWRPPCWTLQLLLSSAQASPVGPLNTSSCEEKEERGRRASGTFGGETQFVCCICCCCCLTSLTKPRRGTRKRRRKERRTGEERQHSFRGLKMRSTTSFCFLTQPLNWYTGKLKKAGVFEHFRVEERVKGKRKKNKSWESKVALHSIETIEVNLFTCRVTFSHLESLKPSLGV